jgi:signal transduction histidine kinase
MLPPLILGAGLFSVLVSGYRSSDQAVRREEFARQLSALLSTLKDAETGQRGFLLTGQSVYLEPFNKAIRDLPATFQRLETASTAPSATSRLMELTTVKMNELRQTVELSKAGNQAAAIAILSNSSGRVIMDQIRDEVAILQNSELAAALRDRARRDRLRSWVMFLTLLIPVLTGILIWRLVTIAHRETRLRDEKELEIETMNRALERRVAERTEKLLEANRDLEEFARSAAHDLRSPVRTASNMVQLVQRRFQGQLPAEATGMLRTAAEGLHRLAALVDELLSYQKLALSEAPPLTSVDLQGAVREAEGGLRSVLEETRATIHVGELPWVLGDEGQLRRLFQNLIENAVKFRRQDQPPVVEIDASSHGPEWIISVRDNGVGFDPEYAAAIFMPFRRLHGPEVPGSGIGLALCARIAERCGGRIWAESSSHSGSAFFVLLQAEPSRTGHSKAFTASAH